MWIEEFKANMGIFYAFAFLYTIIH